MIQACICRERLLEKVEFRDAKHEAERALASKPVAKPLPLLDNPRLMKKSAVSSGTTVTFEKGPLGIGMAENLGALKTISIQVRTNHNF